MTWARHLFLSGQRCRSFRCSAHSLRQQFSSKHGPEGRNDSSVMEIPPLLSSSSFSGPPIRLTPFRVSPCTVARHLIPDHSCTTHTLRHGDLKHARFSLVICEFSGFRGGARLWIEVSGSWAAISPSVVLDGISVVGSCDCITHMAKKSLVKWGDTSLSAFCRKQPRDLA